MSSSSSGTQQAKVHFLAALASFFFSFLRCDAVFMVAFGAPAAMTSAASGALDSVDSPDTSEAANGDCEENWPKRDGPACVATGGREAVFTAAVAEVVASGAVGSAASTSDVAGTT